MVNNKDLKESKGMLLVEINASNIFMIFFSVVVHDSKNDPQNILCF